MKKISMLLFLFSTLAVESSSQLNMDFASRFGPNSPIYNAPLYFSSKQMISKPKKAHRRRKYRDQIKKNILNKQKKSIKSSF